MIFLGIDNGVTGAVCITNGIELDYFLMPVFKSLEYTKSAQFITRINVKELKNRIIQSKLYNPNDKKIAYLERPMVNPKRFVSTKSALRCLEATLIVLEDLNIGYKFIDSKEWQKEFLPRNLKADQLKIASLEVVRQKFGLNLNNSNLSDSILIAQYCLIKESRSNI